jgi:hypothetical protein
MGNRTRGLSACGTVPQPPTPSTLRNDCYSVQMWVAVWNDFMVSVIVTMPDINKFRISENLQFRKS